MEKKDRRRSLVKEDPLYSRVVGFMLSKRRFHRATIQMLSNTPAGRAYMRRFYCLFSHAFPSGYRPINFFFVGPIPLSKLHERSSVLEHPCEETAFSVVEKDAEYMEGKSFGVLSLRCDRNFLAEEIEAVARDCGGSMAHIGHVYALYFDSTTDLPAEPLLCRSGYGEKEGIASLILSPDGPLAVSLTYNPKEEWPKKYLPVLAFPLEN